MKFVTILQNGFKNKYMRMALLTVFLLLVGAIVFFTVRNFTSAEKHGSEEQSYKVVAYVTPWNWSEVPNADKLTHIIYCFAQIDTETHLMKVPKAQYLKQMVDLKEKNPELKVMLSLGGGGGDGFSQAAETEESRKIFAAECKRLIDEYGLDGIDIDWESPVNGNWGKIRAIPEDKENCTALIKEIRQAIGNDKLISFATGSTKSYATWVELDKLNKDIDFFNLMAYCYSVGAPGTHDANLYRSPYAAAGGISVDFGVNMLKSAGVSPQKIVVGIPFFGYDGKKAINQAGIKQRIESGEYKELWDDEAKAPYLVKNGTEKISVTYDNASSVQFKADYIKSNGLGGLMCWEYGQDDESRTMANALWDSLMGTQGQE